MSAAGSPERPEYPQHWPHLLKTASRRSMDIFHQGSDLQNGSMNELSKDSGFKWQKMMEHQADKVILNRGVVGKRAPSFGQRSLEI